MTSRTGNTALITGSTDGVGRVVAIRLGEAGARVLVHGRDRNAATASSPISSNRAARRNFSPPTSRPWPRCGGLPRRCEQRTDRLDILINNAGIGTAGASRQTSADGHELRFAVNYLAGFLLTRSAAAASPAERAGAHRQRRLGRAAADRLSPMSC